MVAQAKLPRTPFPLAAEEVKERSVGVARPMKATRLLQDDWVDPPALPADLGVSKQDASTALKNGDS